MAGNSRRVRYGVVAVIALLPISACTKAAKPSATVTVTVTVAPPTSVARSSAATSRPTTPATTPMTTLVGTCDSVLPLPDVEDALGREISGKTAFVVGVPEKNIGRLAYLNCRYGLGSGTVGAGVPQVEIGVSLYASAAQASQRLSDTVGAYRSNGATRTPVTVAGNVGALLTGGGAPNYSVPLLVVAAGQRTVAVSVAATLASAADRQRRMSAVAALALQRTAG
jgi:hypothetical protein